MCQAAGRLFTIAILLAASMLVSSCIAVGPDYLHPAAPSADRYTLEPLAGTSSAPGVTGHSQHFQYGANLPEQWWRLFRSQALNALIHDALKHNPNLQSTMSALRASKEAVYAQQGRYFPLVQANFNPTRQQTAASLTPIPANGATVFDLYTAQVLVSYTMDIWGLNRRTVESLQAQADMQRFNVEAAYLSLTSNVAVAVIQEASLRGQIAATVELIAVTRRMVNVLQQQLQQGLIAAGDVAVQQAALAQIEATLPPLRKALAQQRDLLTALLGRYPNEPPYQTFTLEALHLPEDLPVSLPSQIIEQRPDVRLAEEQMHSASANIGVATANMLPNITLNANGGYTATTLAGLISPINAAWLLSGNVTQTIFDGANLLHLRREAEATYDQTAWAYRNVVITALQNVADTLRALQYDAEALRAARDFERAARTSFELSRQNLQQGNANVLLLLTSQSTYLQAQIAVVQARANRLADTAALFQALGGGWWNRVVPPTEKILDVGSKTAFTLIDPRAPVIDPHGLY